MDTARAHKFGYLVIALGAAAFLGSRSYAARPEVTEPPFFTGQTAFGQATVEAALDDLTGNTVFLLTPNGAPLPSNANPRAQAPMYIPVYPLASAIPAGHLACQTGAAGGTGNCNHIQVLPFYDKDYDSSAADAAGTSAACVNFNGGSPCTVYLGHDHLIGAPSTHGDFNVAWHVDLVVFTAKAFTDGAINTRITTLAQLDGLIASGDVAAPAPTPIIFNCSIVPQNVYEKGTPITYSFP